MANQQLFPQFNDLPQIPDEQHFAQWSHHNNHYMNSYTFPSQLGRPMSTYEEEMDKFNPARHQNASLDRYLHGNDPAPFVSGMHRNSVDLPLPVQRVNTYEHPWPSSDCHPYTLRDGSPGMTSVLSGASSLDTQNELRSPHPFHNPSYGSPNERYHPALSYPSPRHSLDGAFTNEFSPPGGICCPRDVELHADAEHTVEDQDTELADTKGAFEYPHDNTQYFANYQQSDMDQGDCDSKDYKDYSFGSQPPGPREESVKPASGSSEDSDLDYSPKRNGKRNNSTSSGSGRPKRTSRGRKGSAPSPPAISTTRVAKRTQKSSNHSPNTNKSPVIKSPKSPAGTSGSLHADTNRHFPCSLAIYGCTSTFTSKNEWKRHMATQHIKLGFWRCDLCTTAVDPHDEDTVYHNDFNRKDLFTQHLRRMHADPKLHATGANSWRNIHANTQTPNKASSSASASGSTSHSSSPSIPTYPVTDENIPAHQTRCYKMLRQTPPQSSCLFCNHNFSGPSSWDDRMEHVGRHLEKERKPEMLDYTQWRQDQPLQNWLMEEGLIVWSEAAGAWKIGDGKPRRDSIIEAMEE